MLQLNRGATSVSNQSVCVCRADPDGLESIAIDREIEPKKRDKDDL